MVTRCTNPKFAYFYRYGGRGIKICEGLRKFPGFKWVLQSSFSSELTLDRKDNNGHYSCGQCRQCLSEGWPLNVKWSTRMEQNNNHSLCHLITFNGRTQNITQWAKEMGITAKSLGFRIRRWPLQRAMTEPKLKNQFA